MPFLKTLSDARNLTLNGLKMLSYLTQLFPLAFTELLCEQLLENLKLLLDNLEKGTYNSFMSFHLIPKWIVFVF